MTWVQAWSGSPVDLINPDPSTILLTDISVGLSRINRFHGATFEPWSVAQHSLLVEELLPEDAPKELRRAALLHDAHEAYCGDITTPVAAAIRSFMPGGGECPIERIKGRLQDAIHTKFNLPCSLPRAWQYEIALADQQALLIEKQQLMAYERRDWGLSATAPDFTRKLVPETPTTAERLFARRCCLLSV